VVVVWIGARYAVAGTITPGELVAFYGYSAFLMIPLRTATEYANKVIRGRVAAARICRVLALEPEVTAPAHPAPAPAPGSDLVDTRTGLVVRPGRLTAIVSELPDESAELADRLGMAHAPVDDDVRLGGVPLTSLDPADVRERIVVSDTGALFFSGRLGDGLDLTGRGDVRRALETASAGDILEALDAGLDTLVAERARTFSGGQRQRLVLARALAVDPEILVLVEPTSAVDAHTEARIAARLRDHRAGRTTVVTTSSPLMLDAADTVAFLDGGRIVAVGTHADLLGTSPAYRRVVTRESEPDLAVSEVTP
jgi:ABC-type multidrug transport system fused ATPase/permease subunit